MSGRNPDSWKTEAMREASAAREKPIIEKKNPYPYTAFRPRTSLEPEFYALKRWCDNPAVQSNFSSIFNSLLPYLKLACENTTERDEDGDITIDLSFGRIKIK